MVYGASDRTRRWQRIVFADVIGQKLYFQRHGRFPSNQMAFVKRFLARQRRLGEDACLSPGAAREQLLAEMP